MGSVRQNPVQKTVSSVHMCAVHCVQLLHTILHRTDLIISPLALQTKTLSFHFVTSYSIVIVYTCTLAHLYLGASSFGVLPDVDRP